MNRIKYTTLSLLAAGLIVLASCKSKKSKETDIKINPVTVTTAVPGGSVDGGISISGKIEALQTAQISTRLMGTITRIYVKAGDRVRRGQVLATISRIWWLKESRPVPQLPKQKRM